MVCLCGDTVALLNRRPFVNLVTMLDKGTDTLHFVSIFTSEVSRIVT